MGMLMLSSMFLVPLIIGETYSLVQSCESEGICAIHVKENRFSCGETIENATRDDLPSEYNRVWGCLEGMRVGVNDLNDILMHHTCYRNGTWFKILVASVSLKFLRSTMTAYTLSLLQLLSKCTEKSSSLQSKIVSMKCHGGIIKPDTSTENTENSLAILEEISLDSNNITTVDGQTFSQYQRLRSLSLSYNQIVVIEKCALPISGTVLSFNISSNEPDCCSILHLKDWEAYWKKKVVHGTCKMKDKIIDFEDDFTAQCPNNEPFDCIATETTSTASTIYETSTIEVTTTTVSAVTEDLSTEDTIELKQIGWFSEELLRTFLLVALGISVALATGVTIGTLKFVNRKSRTIGNKLLKDGNLEKKSGKLLEHGMEKLFRIDKNDPKLLTYPSNNVPPAIHQLEDRGFLSGSGDFERHHPPADSIDCPYIDSLPYTVEGYLDLSRV